MMPVEAAGARRRHASCAECEGGCCSCAECECGCWSSRSGAVAGMTRSKCALQCVDESGGWAKVIKFKLSRSEGKVQQGSKLT